jgi:hypothetical protein
MSEPRPAEPVKLVMSLFAQQDERIGEALRQLAMAYGLPDFISAPAAFAETDYYRKEFGDALVRRFAAFARLVRPESLPEIKNRTNVLERQLAAGGERRVNIDPGYLARAHLILATGKGYAHRPYLRDGIYADLTLIYRSGGFHPLPWTYPDYAGPRITGILSRIREKYVLQLRGEAAPGPDP